MRVIVMRSVDDSPTPIGSRKGPLARGDESYGNIASLAEGTQHAQKWYALPWRCRYIGLTLCSGKSFCSPLFLYYSPIVPVYLTTLSFSTLLSAMDKPPLSDGDLERQPTRGRITYAPDVDAQIEARLARTNTRRSRSRSRDSMSIRKLYILVGLR